MTGKYIERLIKLMEMLEQNAVRTLENCDEKNHIFLLHQIKYLAGYIETLKNEIV